MLSKILEFVLGGTRGFNEAETRLLDFVMDALPPGDGSVLSRQRSSVRKVQRPHSGQMVVAYYKPGDDVPRLPYPGDEYCLATVTYLSQGRAVQTSLVLHNGRFMTFERNVPESLADVEALISVLLHPMAYKSVASEIDAQEH